MWQTFGIMWLVLKAVGILGLGGDFFLLGAGDCEILFPSYLTQCLSVMKMSPKLGKISLIFHVLVNTDRKYYGIYLMAEISLCFLIFAPLIVIFPIFSGFIKIFNFGQSTCWSVKGFSQKVRLACLRLELGSSRQKASFQLLRQPCSCQISYPTYFI